MTFDRALATLPGMVSVMDNVRRGHTIARLQTNLEWNDCVVQDEKAPGWRRWRSDKVWLAVGVVQRHRRSQRMPIRSTGEGLIGGRRASGRISRWADGVGVRRGRRVVVARPSFVWCQFARFQTSGPFRTILTTAVELEKKFELSGVNICERRARLSALELPSQNSICFPI